MKNNFKLPSYVKKALGIMHKNGYKAYVVGGAVRDMILEVAPKDYDIATNALTEEVIDCFTGFRIIPTGLKHGTVTVVVDGNNVEITTFRVDGDYEDNRRPKNVTFTSSLEEDLSRRDFTINALAYSPQYGVIDYFGGIKDIKNGIIKCVGNPNKRFEEDALRILRALRFSTTLSFKIDKDTNDAMFKYSYTLKNISKERICSEFNKILMTDHSVWLKSNLGYYKDIISVFIPEISKCFGFKQNNPHHYADVYIHTLTALKFSPQYLIVRLAVFFHDIGKPHCYTEDENGVGHFYKHAVVGARITKEVMEGLKYDRDTIDKVVKLVEIHDMELVCSKPFAKRQLGKLGEELFRMLLEVKFSDKMAQNTPIAVESIKLSDISNLIDEVISEQECFSLKDLAINGNDLIKLGFPQGEKIGNILKGLLSRVIDGEIPNDKKALLDTAELYFED